MDNALSEEEFDLLVKSMVISKKAQAIAYGVLVQGRPRSSFVAEYKTSHSNVTRICKRVMDQAMILRAKRQGLVQVNVFLPASQAEIVEKMAEKYLPNAAFNKPDRTKSS